MSKTSYHRAAEGYPQAGDKEDIGEGAAEEPGMRVAPGSWSNEALSIYLVCIAEEEGMTQTDDVEIGLVAVEISTGDVLYSQFRYGRRHWYIPKGNTQETYRWLTAP